MTGDHDSAEWWDALTRHELVLQRCDDCATWRWPARVLCNHCGSTAWHWQAASGRGTVASWIVNRHPFSARAHAPYVVVMIRLDEQDDILMPGWFDGPADGEGLTVGMPVAVGFDDTDEGALLRWRAAR